MSQLAIVIVTYQTRDLLRKCLSSLQAECERFLTEWNVIVVDNASTDGTSDMVRSEFPHVGLIANPENLGPARAFNIGVSKAVCLSDLIVVMNSDVLILPGTLEKMMAYLEDHPEVDGVSGPFYYPDMTPQKTRTHIMRLFPINRGRPFREDFVGTTFAMIRSRAYRKVGGYDENYYFYNEDLDWAERSKRAGCTFVHLPDAGAIHVLGQGRKQNVSRIIRELYKSNIYYFKRHYPRLSRLALLAFRLEIWLRILALRRELASTGDEARRAELMAAIATYTEARRNMDNEYPRRPEPRVPTFFSG
ncbi:MAG TPA: glycosyltransferase family 2 protein [Firmicutes bacterium]|nr:glycosyltransferase family 2 protein [Bacillota bacterium]